MILYIIGLFFYYLILLTRGKDWFTSLLYSLDAAKWVFIPILGLYVVNYIIPDNYNLTEEQIRKRLVIVIAGFIALGTWLLANGLVENTLYVGTGIFFLFTGVVGILMGESNIIRLIKKKKRSK